MKRFLGMFCLVVMMSVCAYADDKKDATVAKTDTFVLPEAARESMKEPDVLGELFLEELVLGVGDAPRVVSGYRSPAQIVVSCPDGKEVVDVIFNRAAYSLQSGTAVLSQGGFIVKLGAFKRPDTMFAKCGASSDWYRFVFVPAASDALEVNKKMGLMLSANSQEWAIRLPAEASYKKPVIHAYGNLYATLSSSDTNLVSCPAGRKINFPDITDRDHLNVNFMKLDASTVAIQYLGKLDTKTGKVTYAVTFKNLLYKVQCGDDPIQNLWVRPMRIPGQMVELR